jgi:hypothetical protein
LRTESISAAGQTADLSTVLVGSTAYLRGNYLGLRSFMDFTDAAAQNEAGHWLFLKQAKPAQARLYEEVAAGLTVPSLVSQLPMFGTLTLEPLRVVHGESVYGVKGEKGAGSTIEETLYVRATGAHLPVELDYTYKGISVALVFTTWGQPPAVTAPTGAVPVQASWLSASA